MHIFEEFEIQNNILKIISKNHNSTNYFNLNYFISANLSYNKINTEYDLYNLQINLYFSNNNGYKFTKDMDWKTLDNYIHFINTILFYKNNKNIL